MRVLRSMGNLSFKTIYFIQQEKTREQREAELIPKVKEALTLGITVIEQAFEKLDSHAVDSDSEEEEDTGYRVDPILEAKVRKM